MTLLLAFGLALLDAAYHDDRDTVEALLRNGANANEANDLGATPLWAACQNGSDALVERLLRAGANPNLALAKGETPLMVAARGGYAGIVTQLLAAKANPNARAARGQTALMWAAARGHSETVGALLTGGADPHLRSESWTDPMAIPPHGYRPYNKNVPHGNDTALLFAARSGDLESAKLLIAAGAEVNHSDAWGVTALLFAAHSGHGALVEQLLAKGSDPNLSRAGFRALHIAILRRDERMAAALLARGADPNAKLETWTPVRRSSKDLHFDPALTDATPFWLAARYQNPSVLRLLAKHGADVHFLHHSTRVRDASGAEDKRSSNAVLAAMEQGGGGPAWVEVPRGEKERRIHETVKTALELGVPAPANALSVAKSLRLDSVVTLLAAQQRPGISATAMTPDPNMPRPIAARDSVFIEELTWLEVRDALKNGFDTVLVATGGVEQNGPYLAAGKHNYVLKATTEAIARKLGKTLVAPIVAFVPEGQIHPPTGHMKYPSTISLRPETFKALLTDITASLQEHGFRNIIFIGDSGGNQAGMKEVAAAHKGVYFIPEYYDFYNEGALSKWLAEQGIREVDEGYHDNAVITAMLMAVDPTTVRMAERRAKGKFSINGVELDPAEKTIELGKRAIAFRAETTVAAIRKALGRL